MEQATIVEVGPRDGFQSVPRFIPTATKIEIIKGLYAAGLRRIEATSFVSPRAVPQMADAAAILSAVEDLPGLDAQALVMTARHAVEAVAAGARHIVFVVSVSERHNRSNARRMPAESLNEFRQIVRETPSNTRMRLNVATAFDCPYDGTVADEAVLGLLDAFVPVMSHGEVALCDTTGRAAPTQVERLFSLAACRFPEVARWAFHPHDTFGLGAANSLAAWNAGVRVFDTSIAGLGGCPFAPGATGNLATEDLQWMFMGMGVQTGLEMAKLLDAAVFAASLAGAQTGGRVRDALLSSLRRESATSVTFREI
jgi:hydroxymethylglutaryl-CoA lyase